MATKAPKFCTNCGTPLVPGARFCGECGTAVAGVAAPPAPEAAAGERRQVTVLFADLSGYTRLSSEVDAETLHGLMRRVFQAVDGVVENFGGTVDKHIGDAVMALFGAPVAHDNDPERAVRAAVAIHEAVAALEAELGRPMAVHVGVASGAVVAGGVGGDGRAEYSVVGESVNFASRLQDMAGRGETLISDGVYREVSRIAACEALGEVAVKGFDRPAKAWRVTALRGVPEPPPGTPFIGRRAELRQFSGIVEACREDGAGQAVLVRGDAGIGKSRMVQEFIAVARRAGFASHKELVLDFGVGAGQDAVRALVRSLLGAAPASGADERREAAEAAEADGLVDADERVFLNDLLDLPQPTAMRATYDAMDNETRNRGKLELVAALVRRAAARQPLVLAVEDVHWADPATLDHLAAVASILRECPAVLVMTSRIEGDPLDHAWRGATRGAPLATVDIGPLREDEAAELAGALAATDAGVAAECVARAEGNPLFLEQLLRSAAEAVNDDIPASIQSLVLARMDRLAPADKRALQAAAVIGQRFALAPLRRLIGDSGYDCAALVDHFLVRPEGDAFLFAHPLIREGVYSSLLKARARELHRAAAEWFADRDPVLRAEHLDRAEDPEAAGAYLAAATAQMADYRFERARSLVERGLELATEQADEYALTYALGRLLHDLGSVGESIDAYRRALALADGDAETCRAWIGLAAGMRITDDFDGALQALDEAEAAATRRGLTVELAHVHHMRGNLYFPLGNIEGCREQHELGLRYAQEARSPESEARALGGLGDAEYVRGRMISAHDYFRRCVEVSRTHGFGRIEVANLPMVAHTRLYLNELAGALDGALAAIAAAARVGGLRAELIAQNSAFFTLFEQGEMTRAREHVEKAQALVRHLGAWRFEAENLLYLAKVERAEGRRAEALDILERGLAIARETGIGFSGPGILGVLALVANDSEMRRKALADGERILREGAVSHSHFFFYRDAIDAALENGDWDDAERYAAALEDYTRPEPLPWSDFFIARGRALAAFGRGRRDAATMAEIARLRDEAARVGLRVAGSALEHAGEGVPQAASE